MAQPAQATQALTTQAEVGHEGAGHSNFPPFDTSTFPSQLVWLAIAFGLMYWYMSKRALPQLGAVIEARRARIASDLDDATAMQQRADAAAAAHAKTLADARAKAQGLAQAARDRLAAESDAKRKALEDELERQARRGRAADRGHARRGDDECRGNRARGGGRDRRAARRACRGSGGRRRRDRCGQGAMSGDAR